MVRGNNSTQHGNDDQDQDSNSEEDASLEGAVVRHLFQMYPSSSSSLASISSTTEDNNHDAMNDAERDKSLMHDTFTMENVILAQQEREGIKKISDILWPSASFLASFVLNFYEEYVGSSVTTTTPQLGAGVGYTGLKLALELPCKVLLTDMEEAIPSLNKNIQLNSHQFRLGSSAVSCTPLLWGAQQDSYLETISPNINNHNWLILASDCVYYEELHLPLEQTLASLLSSKANSSSHHRLCLLAGMRRWKRDNTFYSQLGRRTRTSTHTLQCTCLHELVEKPGTSNSDNRNILRVYAVRWVARHTTAKAR